MIRNRGHAMASAHAQSRTWTIRAYRPGDEEELTALFLRVFGRPITAAHWRWKLKQLPSPVENVWLAVDDDRPIFQYAGIPVRYHLPGGDTTIMVSVDTMTDPGFRRRGLLTEVGQSTYAAWREAGVPFVIGLPNQQWGSRTGALGWDLLFPLRWLIRPLRPEAVLARRLRLPALARLAPVGALWSSVWDRAIRPDATVRIRPIDRAGPEIDRLWRACLADARLSVVRDSAWVHWRYLTTPALTYHVVLAERAGQPVGYLAYRLEENDGRTWGYIAELQTPQADAKARYALIAHAIAHLRAAGAEVVLALAVPGTWMYGAFRRAGFIWGRRGFFTVQVVPLDPSLPMDLLRDPQNWNMAGGDFDVI
jgi:hypothetical protein